MNFGYNLLTAWAQKIAYRCLQIAGATDEQLSAYVQACVAKKENLITADSTLGVKLGIANYIKWGLFLFALFLAYRLYILYKRK